MEIEAGPGRHPQSTAVFLYFKGPEGLTYEYSVGSRLITDDEAWHPRYFDPAEPDAIDLWRGKGSITSQRQVPLGTAGPREDMTADIAPHPRESRA